MLNDVRFGLRMLRKQPGFTAIAVLTLALGIGATAAVFSLIQGVLLTPPPYKDPQRLALIPSARTDGRPTPPQGWPAGQWTEWQKDARSIDSLAAYLWTFNFLVDDNGSESLEGMVVTRDYFRVLGIQPILGRTFTDAETRPSPPPVIIIGYDLWQRKFHADPAIVGKTMRMSRRDTPPTIVGVMPPGVRFLPSPLTAQEPNYNVNAPVDFWQPGVLNPDRAKAPFWNVVARIRDDATLEQARAELAVVTASQARAERDFEGTTPRVESLAGDFNRDGRRILLPLLGAATLVLLIACGNVAALLLVRGLQRQDEYAVRSALGVGRAALFRQVGVESLLIAILGGALGMALALGIVRIFKAIGGHAIPRLDAVATGWPVLVCGIAAAVTAAVVAGLLPAVRASGLAPMEVLKSGGPKSSAGRGERRLLRAVTSVQTAMTLALLVGAGLLIRTMSNLATVPAGYRVDHVLTATVTAVQGDWAAFHQRALERVSALPGVSRAAFAWGVPLTGNNWAGALDIEGRPEATKASERIPVPLRAVTQGYFDLLGLALLDGRDFRTTDDRKAPAVAIVNKALADRYFSDGSPIGKRLFTQGRQRPTAEIVGVVANARTDDLTRQPEPELYFPLWQWTAFSKDLVIRTAGDPRSVMAAVQRELRSVDPTVAVENVRTLEQIRSDSLASQTFAMQLLVGFAFVASVLTLVGIYGVLSLSVAARRRELAIRAAVGAASGDIRRLIVGEAARLIAGGVAAGVVAAIVLSGVLESFLFGVRPVDPTTLTTVAVLFAAVALAACWVPMRRAARVDPIEALRCE
jgi:putative ABC transport system permease protein